MSQERFIRLVQDFCKACEIADADHVANGGNLVVRGAPMALVHSEKIDPLLVQIHCDMGGLPVDGAAAMYARLLQKNFYLRAVRGPAFAIDPSTRRVLLIQDCELDTLTPTLLVQRLAFVAEEAGLWHYLSPDVPQLGELPERAPAAHVHTTALRVRQVAARR